MFFLLRTSFWLSLVLLALPLGPTGEAGGAGVNPLQALFAAREAIGDVAGLCERKPDVCATGAAAFQTIGVRAKEASRIAYDFMGDDAKTSDAQVDDEIASLLADPIATGGVPVQIAVPQPRPAYPGE